MKCGMHFGTCLRYWIIVFIKKIGDEWGILGQPAVWLTASKPSHFALQWLKKRENAHSKKSTLNVLSCTVHKPVTCDNRINLRLVTFFSDVDKNQRCCTAGAFQNDSRVEIYSARLRTILELLPHYIEFWQRPFSSALYRSVRGKINMNDLLFHPGRSICYS